MFQADVRMIKKQVESLIDREYLKRDEVTASFHTDRTFAAQNASTVLQNQKDFNERLRPIRRRKRPSNIQAVGSSKQQVEY